VAGLLSGASNIPCAIKMCVHCQNGFMIPSLKEEFIKLYFKIKLDNGYCILLLHRGTDKFLAHLLPDVFCLMVRIFRLMLALLHT
jgi:hypothetical protein